MLRFGKTVPSLKLILTDQETHAVRRSNFQVRQTWLGEYNVIINFKNDGQNYENETEVHGSGFTVKQNH